MKKLSLLFILTGFVFAFQPQTKTELQTAINVDGGMKAWNKL